MKRWLYILIPVTMIAMIIVASLVLAWRLPASVVEQNHLSITLFGVFVFLVSTGAVILLVKRILEGFDS
jgi:hypothetical protein